MKIEHMDDVLPHVEGRKDFVVARKDGYTVIDYVYAGPDTFDHPARLECRGIKFAPDGRILARPLKKFFNVGERDETQAHVIDWSRPHVVTEKLDGSMIHPIMTDDGFVRFCTRMGITDVAERCEDEWLLPHVHDWCAAQLECGITPIFEWTSFRNRIVVGYPDDRLVLLAMRDNVSGEYAAYDYVRDRANQIKGIAFPRPLATDAYGDWHGLARHVEGLEDQEGYVVWFQDDKEPKAVKVKAPWYVTRHRALDGLRYEHHVTRLVLEGGVDDVLPLVGDKDRANLEGFAASLNEAIAATGAWLGGTVLPLRGYERKHFATVTVPRLDKRWHGAAFRVYDGDDPFDVVVDTVLKACKSQDDCAAMLDELGTRRWT